MTMNAFRYLVNHSCSRHQLYASRAVMAVGFVGSSATPLISLCEKKKGDILAKDAQGNIDWAATAQRIPSPDFWDDVATVAGEKVQGAVDSGVPTSLSYGFICGYSAGFALKKAGKIAAGIFGVGFICLQGLAYNGYITVDHGKLKEKVENMMDLDGDGIVDAKDRQIAQNKIMEVLQYNMPSGGGFALGFVGGIRS